jgi:phage baseplate assembly protein W
MTSTGIDRHTGKPLFGWDHVVQSVFVILGTRVGSRVMRRPFGSATTGLIGRRLTPQMIALWRLLVVLSLERWEPRVRVRKVTFAGEVDAVRDGRLGVTISVDYLPNGHKGDTTVASIRDIEA